LAARTRWGSREPQRCSPLHGSRLLRQQQRLPLRAASGPGGAHAKAAVAPPLRTVARSSGERAGPRQGSSGAHHPRGAVPGAHAMAATPMAVRALVPSGARAKGSSGTCRPARAESGAVERAPGP
jgi:hypothetical protein